MLFKLLRYAVDETADRDLGGGRPSKGHATAAHRVCIFGVLSFSVAIIAATYRSTQQTSYRRR